MKYLLILFIPVLLWSVYSAASPSVAPGGAPASLQTDKPTSQPGERKVVKTNAEWKKILTPDQYAVLREHGTERAFTSPLNDNHEHGVFRCAGCRNALFASDTKFDSGTGWPSFYKPISKNAVTEESDKSYGMVRTEIQCSVCGGHLGHVFNDGPKPTGLRYCMNGVAMIFEKK